MRRRSIRRLGMIQKQKSICLLCGNKLFIPTTEHVIPKSQGGGLIAVSCQLCNNRRGDKPLTNVQVMRFKILYPINGVMLQQILCKGGRLSVKERAAVHIFAHKIYNEIKLM